MLLLLRSINLAAVNDATSISNGVDIISTLTDDVQKLGTDAEFDNLVGLYPVVSIEGGVDTNGDGDADIMPGEAGYARAAITNRIDNFRILAGANGDPAFNTTVEESGDVFLNGGRLYAPFIIANGGDVGFDEFVAYEDAEGGEFNNAATFREDLVAYFAFIGANPDGVAHLRNFGEGVIGFEDLPGGGDLDFNDAVFRLEFTVQ